MNRPNPDRAAPISSLATLTIALALAAGCDTGGEAPAAAGADAAVAVETVPAACRVATERKPPIGVTIRLQNQRPTPLFVRSACVPELAITSCASDYREDVAPTGALICQCGHDRCPVGAPCDTTPLEIAPGASRDVTWDGSYVRRTVQAGKECDEVKQAAAALYRVSVRAFATADDARNFLAPVATAETTFGLGATDVVEVMIRP